MATALAGVIDSGGAAGSAEAWNGAEPAAVTDTPSGAMMASITLAYPCGTVSGGALNLSTPPAGALPTLSGMPTFLRIRKSTGAAVVMTTVMLASDYDVLDAGAQAALGPVVRLAYPISTGASISLVGTLPIVMAGA